MNTYTIQKENTTLTITVKGATVTTINTINNGRFAGKAIKHTDRFGSREKANAQAERMARMNGWKS